MSARLPTNFKEDGEYVLDGGLLNTLHANINALNDRVDQLSRSPKAEPPAVIEVQVVQLGTDKDANGYATWAWCRVVDAPTATPAILVDLQPAVYRERQTNWNNAALVAWAWHTNQSEVKLRCVRIPAGTGRVANIAGTDIPIQMAAIEAADPFPTFPVDVSTDGGAAGPPSDFTYTVTDEAGNTILSGVSPQNQRPSAVAVQAASQGYCHYELVGGVPTLTLGWVNEVVLPSASGTNTTGYDNLLDESGGTASESDNGTIEFAGPITMALIAVHNEVVEGAGTDEVRLWVDPADLPNPTEIPSTTVTVITDIQINTSTKKFQYKTTLLTVQAKGTESAWTDFHTGAECT